MKSSHQSDAVLQYFDDLGEREWERLNQAPADEAGLYIHTHCLRKHISAEETVLKVGAGPGRFIWGHISLSQRKSLVEKQELLVDRRNLYRDLRFGV
jgi:hypothetical protein